MGLFHVKSMLFSNVRLLVKKIRIHRKYSSFYGSIEEGVRDAVCALRNAGINTECSCHHDGYIQCQSLDPTTEQQRIFNVLTELGIDRWTAVLTIDVVPSFWSATWEIKSNAFQFLPQQDNQNK
jgi:hypothetical protein